VAHQDPKKMSRSLQPPGYTAGVQFQFIDEQERQRDPSSHLRTIVRSSARKNYNLKQQILKSANTSNNLRRLKIRMDPTEPVGVSENLNVEPLLRNAHYDNITGVTTQSIHSRQHDMQEEPTDSRESTLSQGTKRAYASSQPIVHVPAKHTKRPRKRPKRLNKTKALERPFYGSFNSQSRIQLARGTYLHQHRTSPQLVLGQGKADPFDSFPVKMQTYTHGLVDYCRIIFFRPSFAFHFWSHQRERFLTFDIDTAICSNAFPKEADGFTHSHTNWVPTCMENEMAFKSMLLAAETSLGGTLGQDPW